MRIFLLTLFLLSICFNYINAQNCTTTEKQLIITIVPDQYEQETTWDLKDTDGAIIATGNYLSDTICLDSSACAIFTIYDSFGDGICCSFGDGSYTLTYDGVEVATGGNFSSSESYNLNCPPGFSCIEAETASEGSFTALNNDYWYAFTPDETGIYTITTCSLTTCDSKIWLYDYCRADQNEQSNEGTIYYDDNAGGCGEQANLTAYLEIGSTYYIRIGSDNNTCTEAIEWSLTFGGDIEGCTDITACNYSPFANVDDGSCVFDGDPDCSEAPDLTILEDVIENSLHADVINNNADNCMINEGCLQGFGRREIVRFTTHIKNIGDMDYFIGSPNDNPDQFSFDNCHNHDHYEGYAEYRLANSANQLLPIGFKNGFCVLDLECSDGGTPKFGCGNMGITAQCGDIYSSGLQCQWVDVTGVPDGDYTLVVTVNWDQSPDALGNEESDYTNNWAQVCFNLSRDASGNHSVTVLSQCDAYVDCEGTPYGNAEMDCLGDCNGSALFGDLDANGNQNTLDAQEYVDNIIDGGMTATPCFDLNADGEISTYDAALLNSCIIFGNEHDHPNDGNIHNHCNLPGGIENPNHTVSLTILDTDFDNKTIDIGMLNPLDHVVAYEFDVSGITIKEVTNLVDPNIYPIIPDFSLGGTKIIGISMLDSAITKSNNDYQPLCRITYQDVTGDEICISNIVDIVNDEYFRVNNEIVNGCTDILTGLNTSDFIKQMSIYPNPSQGHFTLQYQMVGQDNFKVSVENSLGQVVFIQGINQSTQGKIDINLTNESAGIYFVKLISEKGNVTKRIVIAE